MKTNFGKLGCAAIVGLSASLLVSCENKVAQCNKIIGIANKATTEVQQTTASKGNKLEQFKTMVGSIDNYSKEMSAIAVKDEKLKGFQDRFVKMYQQMGSSSKSLLDAANQKKPAVAQKALGDLQKAASMEQPLVNEVNQYCQGK